MIRDIGRTSCGCGVGFPVKTLLTTDINLEDILFVCFNPFNESSPDFLDFVSIQFE